MRNPRNQLTLAAVAIVLGFLVVLQLRAQSADATLNAMSATELTQLVANLNAHNDELRTEIANLQRSATDLGSGQSSGDASLQQLRTDLDRIRAWAGLEPVSGQGIRVTVSGPITGDAVEDLLNELRNAGAEALAIDGVRIVAASIVAGDAGALSVENTAIGDPFEVSAVGNAEVLTGSLTRAGGIIAQIGATFPSVEIVVTPVDRLVVPATERDLVPHDAAPRL